MKKHITKFNSHKLKMDRNELAGLERDAGLKEHNAQKVRAGHVNESEEAFCERAEKMMREKWMEVAKPVTGCDSYEEMRASVNAELGRQFPM